MKKKQILFSLLFMLSISLIACGSSDTDSAAASEALYTEESAQAADSSPADEMITDTEESEAADSSLPESEPGFVEEGSAESEPEAAPFSYDLVMVGDILLHDRVEDSCRREDGTYDYHSLFRNMTAEIEAADTAIVNQEVILGGTDLGVSGYPAFNAPFEVADALVDAGFDVVCHGTNHALDKGSKGLLKCLSSWEERYPQIEVLGIHDSAEDQQEITYLDAGEITISILNFTYSTNGISMPSDMPYLVDMLDKEKVRASLQEARQNSDFVIVCPHWGTEYNLDIDSYQQRFSKLFLEEGVDLVLGTHPHVIEPIEWLEDDETGHRMLVYYSLGNYVNWTSGTREGVANRMVGGMAKIHLALDENGSPYIESYGVRALVSHVEYGPEMVTVYPLSDYTKELADNNQIVRQDNAFSYDYCIDLCNRIWGDLWE